MVGDIQVMHFAAFSGLMHFEFDSHESCLAYPPVQHGRRTMMLAMGLTRPTYWIALSFVHLAVVLLYCVVWTGDFFAILYLPS